jgi:DNA repair exonuclease SbcCD nuclease subunit
VLAAHQSFDGARVPAFTFREGGHAETVGPRHLPAGVQWILCGHIHTRQVTRLGEARIVQPGSTERASFEERAETKGYAIWTFGSTPSWEFVELQGRPMCHVASEADLGAVHPGTLVKLRGDACAREMEAEVCRRGGWVSPYKRRDPRQGRLFG